MPRLVERVIYHHGFAKSGTGSPCPRTSSDEKGVYLRLDKDSCLCHALEL